MKSMRDFIDLVVPTHLTESQRIMRGFYRYNSFGVRPLFESVVHPEVLKALKDWVNSGVNGGVLIGGLAVSFWGLPRQTQDIDLLFKSENDIPEHVLGFKKVRPHAFRHRDTGVEVEVLTPEFLKMSTDISDKVAATAILKDGVKIADKESIVALKLSRFSPQDQADIDTLLRLGTELDSSWDLSDRMIKNYQEALYKVKNATPHETPTEEYYDPKDDY